MSKNTESLETQSGNVGYASWSNDMSVRQSSTTRIEGFNIPNTISDQKIKRKSIKTSEKLTDVFTFHYYILLPKIGRNLSEE